MVFQGQAIGVMRLYARRPRLFTDSDARLAQVLANQAATAVEQARLLKAKRHEEQLQQQVRLGAAVQRRMLPAHTPALPRFDVAFRYVPSLDLGGDFLDVFEMGDADGPSLGVVVGDVVGKGLPAALLMSACRASLRAHVQASGRIEGVVERVNRDLCRDTLDTEFVTLWFGSLDARTARLSMCSAGHDPPLLVRARAGSVSHANLRTIPVGGLVMGIDPAQRYEPVVMDLESGDVLVAYTDGLLDARSFQGDRFGRSRLQQAVLNGVNLGGAGAPASASEILERVFWELRCFTGLKGQVDDQTVVVVRVK
jgi:sigma-B regulation protein RsbU (phosphoserine phosphatase)